MAACEAQVRQLEALVALGARRAAAAGVSRELQACACLLERRDAHRQKQAACAVAPPPSSLSAASVARRQRRQDRRVQQTEEDARRTAAQLEDAAELSQLQSRVAGLVLSLAAASEAGRGLALRQTLLRDSLVPDLARRVSRQRQQLGHAANEEEQAAMGGDNMQVHLVQQ